MTYEIFFKRHLALIEKKLKTILKAHEAAPRSIHKAMQYAVFTGGKRFRPVLVLSACEACGGQFQKAILPALSVELIHTYSLVHDDLPALDNDDMRRGKPTCHKQFGEANAILTGDALLTFAFELLARVTPADKAIKLLAEISTASGTHGMIGGQVADLSDAAGKKTLTGHDFISRQKTGQLIRVSALAGAISSGASSHQLKKIEQYGECLGLAFQVVDDILDKDGYCKVMSLGGATRKAMELIDQAKDAVGILGAKAKGLNFLADFLMKRIPKK
ncbi:MAG TPA: polyprenyl synthetase family protein [Candidatus Omnitrophota bacterium]|nr:polyprenyl synthetase family protein [Candidatus Omnitrophota bacterium]